MKKQEKVIKKLKQVLQAKASENIRLSAKLLKLEMAESEEDEEEGAEDGEYMEEET